MYVMLAVPLQFNLGYLLRFIIISKVHGALSLSKNVHVYLQDFGTKRFLLRILIL